MSKKLSLRLSRRVVLLIALVLFWGGSTAGAYFMGVSNGKESSTGTTMPMTEGAAIPAVDSPEAKEEIETQKRRVFTDYKKQIEENKLQGVERTTLYVNAALAGAEINAPEAADYAKQALEQMTDDMKKSSNGNELIQRLEKIAAGNYQQ